MASTIESVSGRTTGYRTAGWGRALARGTATLILMAVASGCAYDDLAAQQERISEAWASVERELDRRGALLGDLVPVVRANAVTESALLDSVADARARMLAATARNDRMAAASGLGDSASRLVALGERNPALRNDPRFQTLATEVADTNRRLAAEQQRFNAAVREYNGALDTFPTRLYAKMLGFQAASYLDAGGLPGDAAPTT
jgi:LemA protein